jgi:hypothetical protein
MEQDNGRSGADAPSGHQPTASAAVCAASSQSGVPNAALLEGPRYSPNLRKWVRSMKARTYSLSVYRHSNGLLYIGEQFDDGWFHGTKLNRVLGVGSKAETWAYSPRQLSLTCIADFWARYARIGRCAIDEAHSTYFVGDETRWLVEGDTRSCLWCGNHTQHLRRWLETVERERWEPASAMSAGTAETAQQAQGQRPASAVDEVETPNPSPQPSGEGE